MQNRFSSAVLAVAAVTAVSACTPNYVNLRLPSAPALSLASESPSSDREAVAYPRLREAVTYPSLDGPDKITASDVIDFGELMWRLQDPGADPGRLPDNPKGARTLVLAVHALWRDTLGSDDTDRLIAGIGSYIDAGFKDNEATEDEVRSALNHLITGEMGNPDDLSLHERLRNKIAEITGTQPPTTTTGLRLFQRLDIPQSPEFTYLECAIRNAEQSGREASKARVRRLNRLLIEDLFRRAFATSVSLRFLVSYLDDDAWTACDRREPTSVGGKTGISAAPSLCNCKNDVRRRVLVPGDVVDVAITSHLPPVAGDLLGRSLGFGRLRFAVRYLPDTIEDRVDPLLGNPQAYLEEKRFVSVGLRAHFGKHMGSDTDRDAQIFDIMEMEAGESFTNHLNRHFPDFWNALIDPAVGALDEELPSAANSGVTGLAGRFVRTMLKAGPRKNGSCHKGSLGSWWAACPDSARVGFDNLFEDRFSQHLTICPRASVHANVLGSAPDGTYLDSVPSRLQSSMFEERPGVVSQVRIVRDRIRWADNRAQDPPWSLREWEASRILGKFSPKVSRLYFDGTRTIVVSPNGTLKYPFPKRRFGVDIAWPEDTTAPTVRLTRSNGGPVRLERIPGYGSADPVISYLDLRLLGRPVWFPEPHEDDVDQYLDHVPVGFELTLFGRIVDLVSDNAGASDVIDTGMWSDERGFRPEDALKDHIFSRPKVLRSVGLQDLADYAHSVDGWARYRLLSPEVGTRITGLRFGTAGLVRIVPELAQANLGIVFDLAGPLSFPMGGATRYVESGGLVLQSGTYGTYECRQGKPCDFTPGPVGTNDPKTLYWRDLEKLTAFHVSEVLGLSMSPLAGFLEE